MNGIYGFVFWYGIFLIFSGEVGYIIGIVFVVSFILRIKVIGLDNFFLFRV